MDKHGAICTKTGDMNIVINKKNDLIPMRTTKVDIFAWSITS